MKRASLLSILFTAFLVSALLPAPSSADSGHARIVRLSLLQGNVRYSQQFRKDSLEDPKALWEPAPLNLPIREGFAISTDGDARAEIEFENGAMAFLSGNTVVEFFDLSLDDGAFITRLILRQGSAIFYVHPAKFDFFSVTGGDFSVEAKSRARFRLDNFDDGSTVNVEQGDVDVVRENETKSLSKGQSYSINVNDSQAPVLGRSSDDDDFDKWVSGRIDAVATATTYSQQYVNSPNYSAGFADLYNYGNWYSVPGYGFCWQPIGVGAGWSPFAYGDWNFDASLGFNFIGSAPWGWLPYHYGGWIYNPAYGWVWAPTGFGPNAPNIYRPVTGVWVRSGGTYGIVPSNPADTHSKTPLNLSQGVYDFHGNTLATTTVASAGEKWQVVSHPTREVFSPASRELAPAPAKVSRTILSSNSGSRAVTLSRDSSIVYDGAQHRFVNNTDPERTPAPATAATEPVPAEPARSANPPVTKVPARASEPAVPRATVSRSTNAAPPASPAAARAAHASEGSGWGDASSPGRAGASMGNSSASSSSHSSSSSSSSASSSSGSSASHH
jgi:hypothetical protein